MKILYLPLLFSLLLVVNSRIITFKNQCSFKINVQGSVGIVCTGLGSGQSCTWNVPSTGYNGIFYRGNTAGDSSGFPSATLAEFNLGNENDNSQWNMDWFDISIIPPGCPGSVKSYQGCVDYTHQDGYDVGMIMKPLACPDKTRTCLGKNCAEAYGYPDDIKTTACTNVKGNWEVTFCPPGSQVDLSSGQSGSSTPSNPPPSNPPPSNPPPSNPPPSSGGSCSGKCVIAGFAGDCTGSCPPCWISDGKGGYNCFDKSGGACPAWSGIIDCTKARAQEDHESQMIDDFAENKMGHIGIGIAIGVVCAAILLVVVFIVYRQRGGVESV